MTEMLGRITIMGVILESVACAFLHFEEILDVSRKIIKYLCGWLRKRREVEERERDVARREIEVARREREVAEREAEVTEEELELEQIGKKLRKRKRQHRNE